MSTDRDYLAAGLALGGLSDSELTEAQALADADADFRADVAAYADVMADAAESDEPVEVSSATQEAILSIPESHAQEPAPATSSAAEAEGSSVAPAATDAPPAPTSLTEQVTQRHN